MNPVIENMMERRSVRKFKPDLPTKEELNEIIEAGLYAPTGRGLQSPRFIVVTDPELIHELAEGNRRIGGWPEGMRSEERRVGKECRSRWSPYH